MMKRKSSSNSNKSSFLSKDLADPNLMYMLLFVLVLLVVLNLNTGNTKNKNNSNNNKSNTCYSPLMCDNSQNVVPGKNDDNNDYNNYGKFKEGFTTTQPETTKSLEEQCSALVNKSVAFRHYNTGVTFKKERKGNSDKYFIYGPQDKVLTVAEAGNNLTFEIKSVESNNKQLFKENKITDTDTVPGINVNLGKDLSYFTPIDNTTISRALQYEHGHLTLRNLYNQNSNTNVPFSGQLFLEVDEDVDTHGINLGLSKANLEEHHLGKHVTSNLDFSSQKNLAFETQKKNESTLNEILGKINNLDTNSGTMGNNGQENTQSVSSGDLSFNVDLSGLNLNNDSEDSVSGFKDTFADSASQTLTIKKQIDAHERRKRMKAQRESNSGNRNNLRFNFNPSGVSNDTVGKSIGNLGFTGSSTGILNTGNANKVFRCPSLNRDEYYRDDQLSQCYGCNPDNSLR